jgi:hypothetical protein
MWVFTDEGFYSAVEDWNDDSRVWVRARDEGDIVKLAMRFSDAEVVHTPGRDYAYRVHLTKAQWGRFMLDKSLGIDYGNYKDAVKERQGQKRASLYMRVWTAMLQLQPHRPWGGVTYADDVEDFGDNGHWAGPPLDDDPRLFDGIGRRGRRR